MLPECVMYKNEFPVFRDHVHALCSYCFSEFGDLGERTGDSPGHGAWVQQCERCGHSTWYDVEQETVAAN
jgi:hypothetical protein